MIDRYRAGALYFIKLGQSRQTASTPTCPRSQLEPKLAHRRARSRATWALLAHADTSNPMGQQPCERGAKSRLGSRHLYDDADLTISRVLQILWMNYRPDHYMLVRTGLTL